MKRWAGPDAPTPDVQSSPMNATTGGAAFGVLLLTLLPPTEGAVDGVLMVFAAGRRGMRPARCTELSWSRT